MNATNPIARASALFIGAGRVLKRRSLTSYAAHSGKIQAASASLRRALKWLLGVNEIGVRHNEMQNGRGLGIDCGFQSKRGLGLSAGDRSFRPS